MGHPVALSLPFSPYREVFLCRHFTWGCAKFIGHVELAAVSAEMEFKHFSAGEGRNMRRIRGLLPSNGEHPSNKVETYVASRIMRIEEILSHISKQK